MSTRLALLAVAAILLTSCSDFVERTQVRVVIDAEASVRERIRYVDVEVRSGSQKDDVWDLRLSRRLFPSTTRGWPLRFTLPAPEREMTGYLVTAVAKDANDVTLTVVRALSMYVAGKSVELRLLFDEACVARDTPCPTTFSCSAGQCIDPFVPASALPEADMPAPPARHAEAGTGGSDAAGAAAPSCKAGDACGAAAGCSGAACAPPAGCATRDDRGACQPCPPGFTGSSPDACEPLLLGLRAEPGVLAPGFDPLEASYVAHVSLLQERLVLRLSAAEGASVMVNGGAVAADGRWTSPSLALGDTSVVITVRAPGHGSRTYNLIARREGAQRAQPAVSESNAGDEFGRGVAISGDRLVIGAPFEDTGAKDSGAVYVFARDKGGWTQTGFLKAATPRAGAHFGFWIALDGDQLAIAAPEDSGGGAVHMFEWDGSGLRNTDELRGDDDRLSFGRGVALSGDRLVVGAPGDSRGATQAGSAWVFERSGGRWQLSATLRPKVPGPYDFFGSAVALEGDLIVSGATNRTVEGALPSGVAYLFAHTADGWKEQQLLRPAMIEPGAFFGEALSISGDSIAIGGFNGNAGLTGGAAYVFVRGDDGKFTQQALLRPTNSRTADFFGARLALSGDTLLVTAPREASASGGVAANGGGMLASSGAIYVFSRERDSWRQLVMIKPEQPVASAEFGMSLARSGDEFVVGTTDDLDRDGTGSGKGAVYVFR